MTRSLPRRPPLGVIITVGDELLAGDVADTNARWLGREFERLGIRVALMACLPDDRSTLSAFVRWSRSAHDVVVVTGGLGGTPDDVTRDAVADAFGVDRQPNLELLGELDVAGGHAAVFAPEWGRLPEGSRVLVHALGGAPAFAIENVYVLAGLPSEMRITFKSIREELRAGPPRASWRQTYAATEDQVTPLLEKLANRYPTLAAGSYPRFRRGGEGHVEIVLRGARRETVACAGSWLDARLSAMGVDPLT